MIARCNKRNKGLSEYQAHKYLVLGDRILVDILVSSTPGFIEQITSILTCKRYKYAIIYVDYTT